MNLKFLLENAREIFKQGEERPPWARMFICSLATGLPLLIGWRFDALNFAIYGALIGYLASLNDHLGRPFHRALVATLSVLAFFLSLFIGFKLQGHGDFFIVVVVGLTYWLGLMGSLGAEVERMLLFSLIEVLIGFYASRLTIAMMPGVFAFSLVGLGVNLLGILISSYLARGKTEAYQRLRPSLRQSLTLKISRHLYALSFSCAVLVALIGIRIFEIPRGYWTIVTMVLIMRPDRKEAVHRAVQRLAGTFFGVILGALLVHATESVGVLILATALAAFFIPYVMKRNYSLVSFLVTLVVLFLLSIPNVGHIDPHLPWQRLQATAYGCGMALFGIALFRVSEYCSLRWFRSQG